jgi:putative nucleotidyltransferase with HDIG domain
MSRKIYLIRHAMPDIPIGERWCVGGRTDLPLGRLGRLQAALLPFVPELRDLGAVFCSGMIRARETALPLCPAPREMPGLQEQDMGVWDGLSFREIRERFPELYKARESQSELMPEGTEPTEAVRSRMEAALRRCLSESQGNIAAVSHKGAIASLLGSREGLDYTSVTCLDFDGERLIPIRVGIKPHPALTEPVCLALLEAAGADERLRAHCRAVAALAGELCAALAEKGLSLDAEAVRAAALLHDIARDRPEHPAVGALWLRELGYPEPAELVRQHHDWAGEGLDEAALVYIADKAVRGDRRVPIDERFEASLAKCAGPEALAAHRRRREAAKQIQNEIKRLCGAELLP